MIEKEIIQAIIEETIKESEKLTAGITSKRRLGFLTSEERLQRHQVQYAELSRALKSRLIVLCNRNQIDWNEKEWKDIREKIAKSCALKKEYYEDMIADFGFDHLREDGLYVFKNLGKVDQLMCADPVGKTFHLELILHNEEQPVSVDFEYRIQVAKPSTEHQWRGWMEFDGYGKFGPYRGDGVLGVKNENGVYRSVLYQKTHIDKESAAWKNASKKKGLCYRLVLDEDN